ncbi:protein IVa2 [Southern Psittacara leucophthalmus aviadenovirus]|uniref:Protein IVa2 n=1 Tax=Southern Psittacara leucophthalmus aviadenovirus TaxID=2604330 RepID=A0AAF1DB81_9ADEN|nr:protein IVa2 [Southern Psittacara leucophthalmus aviadenovirus]QEJ80766.1 protein IVa2 [Southern Psittacara leucophthalmus aviadenovirus]
MIMIKRRGWRYQEEEYCDYGPFYERVVSWYKGAVDLCPEIFKDVEFPQYDDFYSLGGVSDKFKAIKQDVDAIEALDGRYLVNGQLPTINMKKQPVIGVIYGPTGSGKSHLIRALLSCDMLDPIPETVIFVTPEKNMIPPVEQTAWNLQLINSNYDCKEDGTIAPKTTTFKPDFIEMTYDEATSPENLNIDNPENVYVKCSKSGPIAIIMDECMDRLCSGSSISVLFHALPSKLFARSASCTAFYVFVVLHSMTPRTAIGNVPTLKVNAKLHIISCNIPQFQFSSFLYNFAHNISKDLIILLKSYFSYLQKKQRYSWVMYTPDPVSDSFRWATIDQKCNIIPLNMNIQECFYQASKLLLRFITIHKKHLFKSERMTLVQPYTNSRDLSSGEERDHEAAKELHSPGLGLQASP